jgi:DNA-binding PadR family transcriptional regulator
MVKRRLKDLEGYILGIVAEQGECTAYRVRRAFLRSPSLFFSASAGSIYPAIHRLAASGLLIGRKGGTARRPAKTYSLGVKGRKAFLEWYFDSRRIADPGFDPLRGRVAFLNSAGKKRRTVLDALIAGGVRRLAKIKGLKARKDMGVNFQLAADIEAVGLKAKLTLLKKWKRKAAI